MKFTCLQENLSKGLSTVSKAVPTKSTLPILSNILISAENGTVKLSATNLETTIVTYIGASVETEGSTTIPARLIKEFISNLSPSTVIAHLKEDILHISSEKTKSKFNGSNANDYPTLPTFPKDIPYLELDPKVFADTIGAVAFAAASDQARPIFTGIYLSYSGGNLTVVSSDGFRLSEKILDLSSDLEDFYTIIPARTLSEISKIFVNSQEPIKFAIDVNENMALFESEDTLVTSQVLGGEYPNYKRIIPTECSLNAEFTAQELLEAVRLTNVFSKELNSPVKIRFNPEGFVHVISASQETGEHESTIAAIIEGEDTEIAFNSKYLLEFLSNIKSERISFKAKSSTTPCIIVPVEHTNFLHVIAPMQIQS